MLTIAIAAQISSTMTTCAAAFLPSDVATAVAPTPSATEPSVMNTLATPPGARG
jgi:hypothetical protein